jgi:hypothetical protein
MSTCGLLVTLVERVEIEDLKPTDERVSWLRGNIDILCRDSHTRFNTLNFFDANDELDELDD